MHWRGAGHLPDLGGSRCVEGAWLIVGGMCAVGFGVSVRSIGRIVWRVVMLAAITAVAVAMTSIAMLSLLA